MPQNDVLIGITWLIYGTIYLDTGHVLARIAHEKSRSPFHWIVPGRWLLAASYLVMAIPFLNVVRIRLHPEWLEPYWNSGYSHWSVVVINLVPMPVLLWTTWRIHRQGLVNDGRDPSTEERTVEALERTATATEHIAEQGNGG